jgi:hypothetical protein
MRNLTEVAEATAYNVGKRKGKEEVIKHLFHPGCNIHRL